MEPQPNTHIQTNNRLLLTLLLIIIGLMFLLYPHPNWLFLMMGLGGPWLLGYGWAKALGRGLRLQRAIRYGWAQVGDQLEERFILTNSSWLPGLWVEISDHTTMPDYRVSRVTGVAGQGRNQWKSRSLCTQRGVFHLGPTTLRTSDPFNLFTVTINLPHAMTVTVTPPIIPLPDIQIVPGGRAGEGRPHPQALERTVSATTVRPYIPGDTLHAIHWPTSARRKELFVRQLEHTPAGDWWLILDLDKNTHSGAGIGSSEEQGVILAASLADRGLRAGRAVGLLAYGEHLTRVLPQTGEAQRWEILRQLAQVSSGSHTLAQLFTQPSFGRLASLIIITATTDPGWIERLLPHLHHYATATVLLLDSASRSKENLDQRQALAALLSAQNITHHSIDPSLFDRPESQPGQQGRWAWRVSPLGRAISVQKPQETNWRELE